MAERALALATPEVWISFEQLLAATGWNRRWAFEQSANSAVTSRPSFTKAANGKPQREYLLASLPPAAQLKYTQLKFKNSLASRADLLVAGSSGASEAQLSFPDRAAVPDHLEPQVRQRYCAIERLLSWQRGTVINTLDGRTIKNTNDLAAWLAAQQTPPVQPSTIWNWLARFRQGGINALADRVRSDRGRSRFFTENPVAATRAQQLYLNDGVPSARLVHETLAGEGFAVTYTTVLAYLRTLPKPLVTLAKEGREAYVGKCSPFILRGPVPVMEWAISDHRRFDVLVRNTLFDHVAPEKLYRPWKTLLLDWGSRKIVGFCFAPTPSSRTINSSNRMAFQQFGFWKNLYWDNGKDYVSAREQLEEISLSLEFQALLQQQRIGVTSALPKHPRSKPIEAHFTRWSKRFDPLWKPAYVGNGRATRPQASREAEAQHAEYLAGKRDSSPLPSDAEFFRGAIQWIEEYNNTPLESLEHRSPNEVFDAAHPIEKRPDPNDSRLRRALDLLLSERVTRTVLQGGCVELNRMRYEPADTASLGRLDPMQGRKIVVLRDPYNLADAVAVEEETHQFLGELQVQQFVAQCPGGQITRDQIQAATRMRRSVERAYSQWLGLLSAISSASGWKTPRQQLLERAGAASSSDAAMPAAIPGARQPRQVLAAAPMPDSPWIDDAAQKFISAMEEEQS